MGGRLPSHFPSEETEAQRGYVSCPMTPGQVTPDAGLEPRALGGCSALLPPAAARPRPHPSAEAGRTHWCTRSCPPPPLRPPRPLLSCIGKKSLHSLIHEAHFLYCHHIQSQQLALVLFLEGPEVLLS